MMLPSMLGLLLLSGCAQEKKYRVGISQCSSDAWRSKMNEEVVREEMLHDNVEVEIRSAEDNNEHQISDLDYFMKNDFDVIAVAPNEAEALTPKIKEIYESGKPVIVFDRTINGNYYTAFQGADNERLGLMAASIIASKKQNPQVLEIRGLKGSTPAELRHTGFRHGADSLGYTILGEAFADWKKATAVKKVDSLLRLYPATNVIYAHNDIMAIGAREVANRLGRKDILIVGIDAAPGIGIKAVTEGKIDATFIYPTDGHRLLRTALAIAEGKPYEKELIIPSPGPVDISNAELLLLQDNALREETNKIGMLQDKVMSFSQKYSQQTAFLYASVLIIILFAVLIFILTRFYWVGKQHRRQMERRNEELARQRDELDSLYHQLQEATGSKLTFFTNVSHDLRTPLTLIADPVHRLAQADNLTPKQHTLMLLADKNVKRLQRLINQILDIRKYDSGQLKLNLVNLNLSEAMTEWTAPFAEIAAKRHIRFSTEIPRNPDIVVAVDIEKTERILFNLLSNAFKFTPENGKIKVTVESDEKDAIIKISDTGIGIPPEDLNNIFERFFKTEEINPNGSGIGLALSKVFIDMHGGSISVESAEGKGSTFTVRFPLKQVEEQPGAATSSVSNQIDVSEIEEIDADYSEVAEDTPVVMIIDDNQDICTLVKSILSEHYTVITASSGAKGLKLANKYVPDLIICDVMMPGMSGYEVCNSLKKDPMTSHIPLLLLTACSRDEQRMEGYDSGADAFMTKPFDSDMLLARCRSLIANRNRILENMEAGSITASKSRPAKPGGEKQNAVEDEFLQKFTEFIEKDLGNPDLSVEYVAEQLGLSRVQLYRKIKALTNYSVAELIRNIRLQHAAVLLRTTSQTVAEIAFTVGFSSPNYFSRCYKAFYNESPAETQSRTSKAR